MDSAATPPAAMGTLRILVSLALLATAVATVAGIWFWAADPAEGTGLYNTLGPVAAFSGLAAGALFIAAAIWAQAKDLWTYLPSWVRVGVMAMVLAGIVASVVSWSQA